MKLAIAVIAAALACAGCVVTADLIRLDPATCMAGVPHGPDCVIGIAVFVKRRF